MYFKNCNSFSYNQKISSQPNSHDSNINMPSVVNPIISDFLEEHIEKNLTSESPDENIYLLDSLIINKNLMSSEQSEKLENPINISIKDEKNIDNNKLLKSEENTNNAHFKIEITPSSTQNNELKNNLLNKKCGRKKKDDNSERVHSKFSDDNLRKKCKYIVLDSVKDHIKEKIKLFYNDDIDMNISKKELLHLSNEQKFNANIDYNKSFLNKTLEDIFSESISTKYIKFNSEDNKNLIKRLKNIKDEYKSQYFKNLLNITFLECVQHFRGSINIKELNGMKCFNEVKEQFSDENEYVEILSYYIMNYEKIINRKKGRGEKGQKRGKKTLKNN